MPRMRPYAAAPVAIFVIAALAQPAGAAAAQRWASPSTGVTTGACTQAAPCRIDAAVNAAAPGDEVIVPPGTYGVPVSLEPDTGVNVHGVAGQPRPWLVGVSGLTDAVLSAKGGGTMSHLAIDQTASGENALVMEGGVGEDLLVLSAGGDAAKLESAAAGTVLRDSVLRTDGSSSDDDDVTALKLHEASASGTIHVAGVTALAPAGTAVRCQLRTATATLVDSILRGASVDVDGADAPGRCTAQASDVRAAGSPGMADGGGNIALDPLFVNAGAGDYRQATGSPTIDAGVADALLGATDPAGCPRPLGAAPDMGAYEQPGLGDACGAAPAEPLAAHAVPPITGPAPVTGDDEDQQGDGESAPTSGDTPPPVIGRRVVVARGRGKVRVRRPGDDRFRPLGDAVRVPVGSVVDTTEGRVKLASAIDAGGTTQQGTFWGARFVVRQDRNGDGMTTLVLRGGNFGACRATATATATAASTPVAAIARRRHRVIRSLWARDHHGRFRTHGANSVATARGTAWLTQDRCDGTRTRVDRGAVAVRDLGRRRTVLVRAGHAYLARG